jgi:hypothetical protein
VGRGRVVVLISCPWVGGGGDAEQTIGDRYGNGV